ncbi:MAG: hypothetical protein HY040_01070 [Planctomycetes bacterium]|nr:hypothetical protein [Planctomycetota bacterium]
MKTTSTTTRFSTLAFVQALAFLAVLGGPWEVNAQSLLPWRNQVEQRLRDQNQLIAQLIAGPRQQAPQIPPIIMQPQPYQLLPIPGEPKQRLPISGDPKQPLPTPGEPKHQLPPGGQPKQELPIPGNPRQSPPLMPPASSGSQGATPYTAFQRALAIPVK